jgi:hypothetical protein
MSKSLKQRRHEFAPDQIACAAEENQIKSHAVLELHKKLICNVTLFHR